MHATIPTSILSIPGNVRYALPFFIIAAEAGGLAPARPGLMQVSATSAINDTPQPRELSGRRLWLILGALMTGMLRALAADRVPRRRAGRRDRVLAQLAAARAAAAKDPRCRSQSRPRDGNRPQFAAGARTRSPSSRANRTASSSTVGLAVRANVALDPAACWLLRRLAQHPDHPSNHAPSPSQIDPILRRLIAAGVATALPSNGDGQPRQPALTHGRQLVAGRQQAARCDGLRQLLDGWCPDEHPELSALIAKLASALLVDDDPRAVLAPQAP